MAYLLLVVNSLIEVQLIYKRSRRSNAYNLVGLNASRHLRNYNHDQDNKHIEDGLHCGKGHFAEIDTSRQQMSSVCIHSFTHSSISSELEMSFGPGTTLGTKWDTEKNWTRALMSWG